MLLIAGILIFLFSALAYNLASVILVLLALRVVHGAGWGVMTTAAIIIRCGLWGGAAGA